MKTRIEVPLIVLALAAATSATAATCDIPMIAQQVAVPPNVMVLVDNSGSMNEAMWHEDYDPDQRYNGNFTWDRVYYVGSDGWREPKDFNYYWPSSPSAYLVDGLHGADGRYIGNYLNWVYFHATDAQRDEIPRVTRQMVANTAVKQVISSATGLRYGLARFNYDSGAVVEAPCGSSTATLEYEIDVMAADSWTPSGEALYSLAQHFKSTSGPIQYSCQKNFIIFVTDGLPTKDQGVPSEIGDQDGDNNEPGTCASIGAPQYSESNDCSDYMDDVAYYMANTDLRGDLDGEQSVVTYTIGFGVDAPLLADTALNGQGLYRLAWNLETLTAELGTVVGDIVNRISSGAAVAVVSTETGTDDRLYRGKFLPGDWRGYLEAFDLPYEAGDAPAWEAGTELKNRGPYTRDIFTHIDGRRVDFTTADSDLLGLFIAPDGPGSGQDFYDGYGVDFWWIWGEAYQGFETVGPNFDQGYVDDVIEYVRGEDIAGFRDRRGWKLGDLVYSTPVVVGPPAGFHSDLAFHEWANDLENRMPVVYVGANDGMLHAFRASDGEELWAFMPQVAMPKLEMFADPSYCHTAMVDLSPKAFDVKIGGSWKTILFGGQRTGGDSYFTIDVTDPQNPEVLWETRVPDLTSSFTEPVLVETEYGPVLWVGSGPNSSGWASTAVFDAATGAVVRFQHYPAFGAVAMNAATAPTPFDTDYDGFADRIYQADMSGQVYRWVLDGADPDHWWYETIFYGDRPVMARPAVVLDGDGEANVVFGTGRFVEAADFTDPSTNRFYVFRDPGHGRALQTGDLVERTHDVSEAEIENGWWIDLDNGAGERVTEPAVALEGVVYFTSFRPSAQPCSSGGDSWLYRIMLDDATPVDSDEDGDLDDESRSESLGSGVASRPVVNLAGEQLIVQTSDARLNIEELSISPQKVMIRAWRERYDQLTQQVEQPIEEGTN